MGADARRRLETWRIVLGSACVLAWALFARDANGLSSSGFCSRGAVGASSLGIASASAATLVWDWALMIVAMMAPLVAAPLQHLRDRSFARRRAPATALFLLGYLIAWTAAGVGLLTLAEAPRASPLAAEPGFALAAAAAALWQASPAKQWALNRCCRRPQLAAFGAAADRDALGFGLTHGAACVGACWALMALLLFSGRGHLAGMALVALFSFAERLDDPAPIAWRWRWPAKALRIAVAQARIRLAS
jgi:predicted metal-binding membrane protein